MDLGSLFKVLWFCVGPQITDLGSLFKVMWTFARSRCPWSRFFGQAVALSRQLGSVRIACSFWLLREEASILLSCLASSLQLLLLLLLLLCALGS